MKTRQRPWTCALLAALLGAGCAPAPIAPAAAAPAAADAGIEIRGLHLSAHGYILDLRYRVRDKAMAAALLDAKKRVYLVDDVRHARLGVPESPVIGGMRQTSRNQVVYTDRDYFILFVNPARAVRVGDRVRLAVDGHEIARLTVQ
jgi:hypothetical protein